MVLSEYFGLMTIFFSWGNMFSLEKLFERHISDLPSLCYLLKQPDFSWSENEKKNGDDALRNQLIKVM